MVRGKGFGFQKNFIACWSRLKERQLLGTKKEKDMLKCTSAEMLPACNLIKTVLLSCRLQRIPRNHKYFSVHITFIKVGEHYNTVFHRFIMKVTKNPIVKTCSYKNQQQRFDCRQRKVWISPSPISLLKNSKQHKRAAFPSQL